MIFDYFEFVFISLVPTPRIDITYNGSLSVGTNTILNCTVDNYSIADNDASMNFKWSRSGTVLSNDTDRVVISNLHEPPLTFISQLILSPLSASDANITCSATAYFATPVPFVGKSLTESKDVQLNIKGTTIFSAHMCFRIYA